MIHFKNADLLLKKHLTLQMLKTVMLLYIFVENQSFFSASSTAFPSLLTIDRLYASLLKE